jgi:hypothetical protein
MVNFIDLLVGAKLQVPMSAAVASPQQEKAPAKSSCKLLFLFVKLRHRC